ncbi:MAG: hypothetical protein M3619_19160 [Myxococcota bacterium]|nr:hypothetical protein [Myxococcota bacterium]
MLGCNAPADPPVVIDLGGLREGAITRGFEVDGTREVRIVGADGVIVEAWVEGGVLDGVTAAQRARGASESWRVPAPVPGDGDGDGELELAVLASGPVELTVWARGAVLDPVTRGRSLAWLDGTLLDDPTLVSFARVMAAISEDRHGGRLLDRWFRAFAAGPGAGRATFVQFLDDIAVAHGADPAAWDLGALPFKVTGVHDRIDLAGAGHCGELRVSIASTHPTFSPVHLIFLFRQPAGADDVTPDGIVHCRGTARAWARLSELAPEAFRAAAGAIVDAALVPERFLLAESVELSISPWQWRQWQPDGGGGLANPPLFQTIDVARVNAPGPTRDAFLSAVATHADAIAARTWTVPAGFRALTAEVQPSAVAPLVDLGDLAGSPQLPRALGMIGCPRCHTDDADFLHTGLDRQPSPFYDRELDARAHRLDALGRGEWPAPVTFGPLQPL